MPEPILVYVDLNAEPHFVGHLWAHAASTESASFQYAAEWCASPLAFALEPALKIGQGAYHTNNGKALFGAIGDSAPDRWGRTLMNREAQRQAKEKNVTPRSLREIDFLLMVNDEARIGALRFKRAADEPFLASSAGVPPVISLGRLLDAARAIENHDSTDQELTDIFSPGSSLGGARPKACVRGTGDKLYVAKFPSVTDEWDVPLWEYVALCLAKKSGISTPNAMLENVGQKNVLLTERFDRAGQDIRILTLPPKSMPLKS
jgi:HipA-like N-terminal domain.